MTRKSIRFEVFKRDGFICQYCGRTPPAVILEVDHVIPKVEGGPDDINNYVTACFDCNRGKGGKMLDSIPPGVEENLHLMEERREQLKTYNALIEDQEREYEAGAVAIAKFFTEYIPGRSLSDNFKRTSVKRFLKSLPLARVEDAMALACAKYRLDPERACAYFCGICWNWIKRPETRNW